MLTHFVKEGVTLEEFQVEFHKQERSLEKSLQTNEFGWLLWGPQSQKDET